MHTASQSALIVVDVQNDFCPEGALAVAGGHEIIPLINRLMPLFGSVILTQDWHPADHVGFANRHNAEPFGTITLPYGEQVLWPTHCVQGSRGAAFHPELDTSLAHMVIRKGFRSDIDSYSAFLENDQTTPTGLAGYLRERDIQSLYFCGLATDYCVAWSALDAQKLGFHAAVLEDACRAIDLEGSLQVAKDNLQKAGVALMNSHELFT